MTTTTPNWFVEAAYGHPAPFIYFRGQAGSNPIGEIMVRAGGEAFTFQSVDLYSSVSTIPYVVTGIAHGVAVLTIQDTLPGTRGNFVTVTSPNPAIRVDTLVIRLTNPPYANNPMGLDNIKVSY